AQDAEGDPLTYSLVQGPSGMTINPTTGLVSWIGAPIGPGLPAGFAVSIGVSDGRGGQASLSFTLFVTSASIERSPQITSTPRTRLALGNPYSYTIVAADPDHDPLTYRLDTAPAGMTVDAAGHVAWTPTSAQVGDNAVALRVEDGRGGYATQRFT